MSQLLILSCSQRKHSRPDLLPAIERYDGPAFRLVRRFLQQPSQAPDIYILSAKFGLISSNQLIPYYDQRMTVLRAHELQPSVITDFRSILCNRFYKGACICAGRDYLTAFDGYDTLIPAELPIKVITGSLGKQLSELHDWLYGKPPVQTGSSLAQGQPGRSCIRGIEVTFTVEEALNVARQALLGSPKAATSYQSWYVSVDDQRVAPKWLVSRLTGLPVSAFVTDEARRVLGELGVEVRRV